ncbi:MAG: segregation/condensation protein A [Chloroflexi bacterium]|nr:segregation/condensation protein A [Chloroflexota bacterium]
MMYSFRLPDFEGPLDLLLHLIEHRELDITRVSLGAVADQYLELISRPGAIELAALADYLIIAAKLILIKSRLLLPQPETPAPDGEEDMGEQLARQLRDYKLFKQAALFLRERERQGLRAYPRFAPPPRPQPTAWKLEGVTADDLANALQRALRIRPTLPQGTLTVPLSVSIDQQIHAIAQLTRARVPVHFSRLLERATSRIEVIVTFLAVLELIKRREISARQEMLFGEIILVHRDVTREVDSALEANYYSNYTTN